MSPDPEPVGVEFLAELPEYVRAFFDEQHKLYSPK
ncbi:chorismate mutase [Burkholderia diffusa]|nr:chorismate mutase [Burkholderia diffusa]